MTILSLDPARLKTVRRGRKIGRTKLAKLSGLTERRIAKFEGGRELELSEDALGRLALALHVPMMVLTGEIELSENDVQPVSPSTCTNGCCG